MNTVELLDRALRMAKGAGFQLREEYLEGCEAGACLIKGQKWLFLDPMQSPREQLEIVLAVLQSDRTAALARDGVDSEPNRRAA